MERKIQQEILRVKKIMSETTLSSSGTLFGGPKVKIPVNGSHAGQKDWASGNAWDIPTDIGTPVYAIASGTLVTFSDYGPVVKKVNGKKLFGIGFTVESDEGLPDVYYTHLKDCTVNSGDHVKCGQLLGYVMDFPDSTYDHLHIGVEWGHDIREFLTDDGKIKCNGKPIDTGTPVDNIESSYLSDIFGIDELVYNPLTKNGGSIGHGYDRGKRVDGITWGGHDNHLHIGFTDRQVAIEVIDKADEMGLKTTENPYAKKDPNNKVDYVHTKGSFHYRVFPGEPKVGGGVDISGDKDKLEELIRWIEEKYVKNKSSLKSIDKPSSSSEEEKSLLDKILNSDFGGKKIKDLIDAVEGDFNKILKTMFDFFNLIK